MIELNINQIVTEAEAFASPYDAKTEQDLNQMVFNGTRVLNQLRSIKSAIDAMDGTDDAPKFANKAVRVFACIKQVENMLLVIEDARGELANA